MITSTLIFFGIAGAVGALINDILDDNCITLPKIKDGKFYLGFLGSLIIGVIVGMYIDGTLLMAFLGGFAGKSIIQRLVTRQPLPFQIKGQLEKDA